MQTIYELKDMLCEELDEYGTKGHLDVGDLEIVDKLAHAIKNIDKIIMAKEYSFDDGVSMRDNRPYRMDGGRDRRYSRENYSSRRGNRYSRRYSMADKETLVEELRDVMDMADGKMKKEFENFIKRIEQE